MPRGRPTKYKKEFCEIAKQSLAEGFSKEATAGKLGINKATFYRWLEEKSEFNDAVETGEALSQLWWEDKGRDACAKGEFNAAVWSMNMKNRFGWRDKQEVTGEGGGPLAMSIGGALVEKLAEAKQRANAKRGK